MSKEDGDGKGAAFVDIAFVATCLDAEIVAEGVTVGETVTVIEDELVCVGDDVSVCVLDWVEKMLFKRASEELSGQVSTGGSIDDGASVTSTVAL